MILSQKEEIRDSSNDGRNLKEKKKKNDKSMLTYGWKLNLDDVNFILSLRNESVPLNSYD